MAEAGSSGQGDVRRGASEERSGDPAPAPGTDAQLLEANRRLRDAAQRRRDLLSMAAQELRGPAASLLRLARRATRAAAGGHPASRALAAIERQAQRVATVAEALVQLRELEAAGPLRRRPTELAGVLGAVRDAHQEEAAARGVSIEAQLPPYPLSLQLDPDRIASLLEAIVGAAVAFTPRGGRVRLTLEAEPGGARITVEDGATSADPARGGVRRALELSGAGLAVAVCRTLAELHGGSLEIAPRGRGRAAVLRLPTGATPEDREPLVRAVARPGKARILVVDDDPDARDALAMVLGDDYDVLVAGDGQEATEIAVVARPDVVLMDLYMPRMDGLAALEALRGDSLTAAVPVILISARGDDLTRSRSLDLGAVDFLQKPFSARELKARIERTLRLTRRESQLQVLARTDPLTGLANVRAFRARLEEEVKRARRYRTPLACVMVDMDNLKPINDELGHAAGDVAIGTVAEVIRAELRETDFGARYGGDEFVLLLPHTSAGEAQVFAERVAARLREYPLQVGGRPLPLSASFGIAALGDEVEEPGASLVRRADAALYEAKRAGRGRVAADAEGGAAAMHVP